MPAPFRHSDTAQIMGSWPVLPQTQTSYPNTLDAQATILGVVRETPTGYEVDGLSFDVETDLGTVNVGFTYASPNLPLDEVIDQINTWSQSAITADIAFRDNGFLLLKSPTVGDGSYLRLVTDAASSTSPVDVFSELGLFSETEAYGGDITQTPHVDPDRQVALPHQLSIAEGESFDARVFNRAVMQLAINADASYNAINLKRVATQKSVNDPSYTVKGTNQGYQFSGGEVVYAGRSATPTTVALEKYFVITDADGRELTGDVVEELNSTTGDLVVQEESGGSGNLVVEITTLGSVFTATDPDNDIYVVLPTVGGAAALNGVPLAIVEYRSATEVVISPIDPATGDDLTSSITTPQAGITVNRSQVTPKRTRVKEVRFSETGARAEANPVNKRSAIVPSRVEKGNRIIFTGEDLTAALEVAVGDVLTWSSHGVTSPYSNNGSYRISKIVDPETLEVVSSDWETAILNPDLTTGPAGTVDIDSDGEFIVDPFLYFEPHPDGYIPYATQSYNILYMGPSTMKDVWDADAAFLSGGSLTYTQEADDSIQRAIMRILGPSAGSVDDRVRQESSISLEEINRLWDDEHYRGSTGRHSNVHADTIFAYQNSVADEYQTQRDVTDWSGTTAVFFNKSDRSSTPAAVVHAVSKSTDAGSGPYVGGFMATLDGESGDNSLIGYMSLPTIRANTSSGAEGYAGFYSLVSFSDGNTGSVAHLVGAIGTWDGTNSLDNEYGVQLFFMTRASTSIGLDIFLMNCDTAAYTVRSGSITAPDAGGMRITGDVSGATSAQLVRGEDISASAGYAGAVLAGVISGVGAYGLYTGAINGNTGAGAATYGAYFSSINGPSAAGMNVGSISASTGSAQGVVIGSAISSGSWARGVNVGAVQGTNARGLAAGDVTGDTADARGVNVGAVTGANNAWGFNCGNISATAGSGRGVETGNIAGPSAYGVIVDGVITGSSAVARALSAGDVDASTGTIGSAIWVGTVLGGTDARGMRVNSISGADAAGIRVDGNIQGTSGSAHALEVAGFTRTTVGTGDATAIQLGSITSFGGTACGARVSGDVSGVNATGFLVDSGISATTGAVSGFRVTGTVQTTAGTADAVGVQLAGVTSFGGDAYGYSSGAIAGPNAYGVAIGATTASAGYAVGVDVETADGTGGTTAYAVFARNVYGNSIAQGFRVNQISGTTASGVVMDSTITASSGNAHGLKVADTIQTTAGGDASAVEVANVSTTAGGDANGFYTGNLTASGVGSARGARFGNLNGPNVNGFQFGTLVSTSGTANGFFAGDITGETYTQFLRASDITANNNDAYFCRADNVVATSGNARGFYVNDITANSGSAWGTRFDRISGNSAVGIIFSDDVSADAGDAYGMQFVANVETTAGAGTAGLIQAGAITAFNGTAYVMYTGNIVGPADALGIRLGAVVSTSGYGYGFSVNGVTGNQAYGYTSTDITGTSGTARGISLGNISATGGAAQGVKLGAISTNASTGLAFSVDSISGPTAYGFLSGAISSTNGNARGITIGDIDGVGASATAHAMIAGLVTAQTAGVGYQVGGVQGTTAYGVNLNSTTSSAGSARAFRSTGVSATGGDATGLTTGAVSATGGSAYGVSVGSVTSDGSAYGLSLGTVTSTGGTAFAISTNGGIHRLGGDVDPQGDAIYDLGDETDPLRWRYIRAFESVLVGEATVPGNETGVRVWRTYTANKDVRGINSTVTSTYNSSAIDVWAMYATAISNASGQQKSVIGLEAIAQTAATGAGADVVIGVRATADIDNGTGASTYAAAFYAKAETPATAPNVHVGFWGQEHSGGSQANATFYSAGGANIFSDGSLAISKDTELLSATYYPRLSANHTLNLIGDTTVPSLNFDNIAASSSATGSSWYMQVGSDRFFRMYSAQRNGGGTDEERFSIEPTGPATFTQTGGYDALVSRSTSTGSVTNPTTLSELRFDSAGTVPGAVGLTSAITYENSADTDGKIDSWAYGVRSVINVPGLDSGTTIYGFEFRHGAGALGIEANGNVIGFEADLRMYGTESTARGVAKCFVADIGPSTTYDERYGFYVDAQDTNVGSTNIGYMVESMWSKVDNAVTAAFYTGNIVVGESSDRINTGQANGLYISQVKAWANSSTFYARGVSALNIAVDNPGSGSNTIGFYADEVAGYTSYGIVTSNIDAEGTAYGFNAFNITGANRVEGITLTNLTDNGSNLAFGQRIVDVRSDGSALGIDIQDINPVSGVGTGDTMFGIRINNVGSSGDPTTSYGIYVQATGAGATTGYGVYISEPTATTSYALYAAGQTLVASGSTLFFAPGAYNNTTSVGPYVRIASSGLIEREVPSMREVKTNIEDAGDTSWVYNLRPVKFEFKQTLGLPRYGLIAEEVEEVFPDLAMYDYEYEEVEDGYTRAPGELLLVEGGKKKRSISKKLMSVEYPQLIPILLNEVQRLNKRLEKLEKAA